MPTETRTFTAEELTTEARGELKFGNHTGADMLRFSAQLLRERDALQRQVDGIRSWLEQQHELAPDHRQIDFPIAVLAELDRLAA